LRSTKHPPFELLLGEWRVAESRDARLIRCGRWLGFFRMDADDYSDERQPLEGRWYEYDD
jgi:hypothetical protein